MRTTSVEEYEGENKEYDRGEENNEDYVKEKSSDMERVQNDGMANSQDSRTLSDQKENLETKKSLIGVRNKCRNPYAVDKKL